MLQENVTQKIVESIQVGLKNAKISKKENEDEFDNSEHFRKLDKIMSSLYENINEEGSFETFIFKRGSYKLLFAYDREKHILISFMGQSRINNLINSNNIKDKQNYIFGLMQFNEFDRQQIGILEMDIALEENQKIKNRIKEIIEDDSKIEYITIVYNISKYSLLSAKEIKYSQYAEIIDEKNLSDYIMVDYEEIYGDEEFTEETVEELEFNFKDDVLIKLGNLNLNIENESKEEKNNE